MARTSTYLHFSGTAEDAFALYKTAFGTEFEGPIERMGDLPAQPDQPEMSDEEKHQIMSVKLPITGGHLPSSPKAPPSNSPSRKCSTATTLAGWSTGSAPSGWSVARVHPDPATSCSQSSTRMQSAPGCCLVAIVTAREFGALVYSCVAPDEWRCFVEVWNRVRWL
jgi:hypothetical protein